MAPPHTFEYLKRLATTPNASIDLIWCYTRSRMLVVKAIIACSVDEAKILHILQDAGGHPHVVEMFGCDGETYQLMEYCGSGDLLTALHAQDQQRFQLDQAMEIFSQIARGVQFLHAHNIAHMDLSLENVLLSDDGQWKLCDFGLSVPAAKSHSMRVGKLCYMAPEVYHEDAYDPKRTDIWSLGIILFILLTGSSPLSDAMHGGKAYKAIEQYGCDAILKAWRMDSYCTPRITQLLSSMMQVDPSKRIASVTSILNAL